VVPLDRRNDPLGDHLRSLLEQPEQTVTSVQALVHEHGTESQQERFAANRLPENELRDIARALLFRPLDGFKRFRKIEPGDIRHEAPCSGLGFSYGSIASFKVEDNYKGPMADAEWSALKAIEAALVAIDRIVTVNIRQHVGVCTGCDAERHRLSVLVTGQLCGMTLSREYAL
jgi:hypothetical protein